MRKFRSHWCALPATVTVVISIVSFGWAPAAGQEQAEKPAPVMVTLDASGSMADTMEDGVSKMDAAKAALNSLVDSVGPDAELGLQVYGSKGKGSGAPGCDDIVTKVPVGPVRASEIKAQVASLEPAGETPIGDALRKAAGDLPDEGPRAVVLISDGLDTCAPPDPCDVAKELAEDGVDLSVHTVGFDVDDEAREQLSCIAESTGGTYTDAPDAKTLDDQLPTVVKRAQRSYEAEGTPITGSEDHPQAPEIDPGQYVDTIDSGQTKYYRLQIPAGFTVHFAATAILPKDETGGWAAVNTQLVDSQRTQCAGQDQNVYVSAEQYTTAHGTSAFSWDSRADSECAGGGEYYLSVERVGPEKAKHWTWQTEILVTLEPPMAGSAGPDENTAAVPFTAPGDDETPVTGGGSFNDAIDLPGSGTYADTLLVNEMATYKVRLDWGEALAVQTHAEHSQKEWVTVSTGIFDPVRKQPSNYWRDEINLYDQADAHEPIATSRILYNNRNSGTEASMAGWYYITVQTSGNSGKYAEIPIRLSVSKGGEPVEEPEYAKIAGYPAAPVTGTVASEDPGAGLAAPVETTVSAQETGLPAWAWIVLFCVAVGAGGAILTVVLIRSKKASTGSR